MIAPDGSSGEIPTSKVKEAIQAGGKPATWMIAPDGSRGIVPLDRSLEAIQAGARPQAPLPNIPVMQQDILGRSVPTLTSEQQQRKGQYESANLKPIGETLGAIATGGLLPTAPGATLATKAISLAGRAALSGAGTGVGALAGGARPGEAAGAAAAGTVAQPIAEGVSAVASSLAPKLAESALGITQNMRARGRTPGEAILEQTSGIKLSTLAPEIKQAVSTLTNKMEQGVDAATQSGVMGSTQSAHQALNDALADLPRNAKTIRAKVESLHDLLDLDNAGTGPVRAQYTPTELLEMKRGIGKEIETWPPEWQKMSEVKRVQSQLYGSIDNELDRLVPGNSDINQAISSLLPAKSQSAKMLKGASLPQRAIHRVAAHTGALTGAAAGGYAGDKAGGLPGAIAGTAAGLIVPEAISSSAGQMLAARFINSVGEKATAPEILPFVKALAAHSAGNLVENQADNGNQ